MLVYYFFLIGVFIISLDAFVNYVNNSEVINQMYLQSQVMPTIVSHHPTFSIMITFAIYVAYYLYKHQFYAFNKNSLKKLFVIYSVHPNIPQHNIWQ